MVNRKHHILTFTFLTLVALADLQLPLGVAAGILYILPIVVSLPQHNIRFTKWLAFTVTILIILGWWLSPNGSEVWKIASNRLLSIFAVWLTYWTVVQSIQTWQLGEKTEHQFRQVFEAAPNGEIVVDQTGTIRLVNSTASEQFGYRREELVGQPIEVLIPQRFHSTHPEERESFCAAPNRRRMAKGRELHALRKDGTEFPVEIGLSPLTTEASPLILASVVDVSEQKQAEDRYKNLIHSNLLLMWTCSSFGECDFLNDRWLEYTGKTSEEQLGYGWLEQLHPDDRDRVNETWQDAIRKESSMEIKFRIRRHDGIYRWFLTLANPLRDKDGNLSHWVGCNIDIEEQHQTERALQSLHAQNQYILESAGEGIWGLDLEGNTTFVNPTAARMLGYQAEELIGQQMHKMVHHTKPDGSPYPNEDCPMYAAFTEGSMEQRSDEYLWRKDGSSFPVSYTSTPIRDEREKLTGAVIVFHDITEEIKTQRMLIENAIERSLILDNVPALIASFDRDHLYRFANKRYLEWFNISESAITGKHAQDVLTPEMYTSLIKPRMERALAGETVSYQLQAPHASGTPRWVQATYVPDRDANGVIHGFLAMVVDIHQHKLHEAQLQQLTDRLQLATQSAKIGVWDWDIVNNVLTWDEQMYALYGLSQDMFSGAYDAWTRGLHPDDSVKAQKELQDAVDGGNPFNTEFRVVWSNRSVHHLRACAIVNRDEAGHAIRMTGVNWDITPDKLQEQALTQYIDDLRRSNAELEQFAYVASHDLQEPLRKIRNFSELLSLRARGHIPPEAEKYLATIVNGAVRMQALVQDLLSYSRVARGDLTIQSVNLQDVVKIVLENLDELIRETKAIITIDTLPTIQANQTQMEQLLQNLIGNGLKYRTDAAPVIDVKATRQSTHWRFSVRDNGIGIDPQYAERIFVIFQRLHTKQEFSGTGIGLAICKKIVELHGGEIWVESTLNQGSTFFFTLPGSHEQDRQNAQPARSAQGSKL